MWTSRTFCSPEYVNTKLLFLFVRNIYACDVMRASCVYNLHGKRDPFLYCVDFKLYSV